jgi:squalene synthase HpnC
MPPISRVIADLAVFGPEQSAPPPTLVDARAYCRQLARTHYENFTVANWLLPKPLRQHYANIYAYCRWADDLADETGDAAESLRLLDWWQSELDACYRGEFRHPVFVALADTIRAFGIPPAPFARLLTAFRQDQSPTKYETFDELLGYCHHSADPVGELVLYLNECHTAENVPLSNSICSGLQLANFWQDVARDYDAGRVYLPAESLLQCGYTRAMLAERTYNSQFCELMKLETDRAEQMLHAGRPLIARAPQQLRMSVAMFLGGGLAILERIRKLDYNVWRQRPRLSRWDKLRLAAAAWRSARTGIDLTLR